MARKDAAKRTFHEISLLDTAIRAGQGLGIINMRLGTPGIEAGTMIPCFAHPEELTAAHQVIISPEAYRRPEVRAFTKFFTPR